MWALIHTGYVEFELMLRIIEWFDYTAQCDSEVYLHIYDVFTCFGQLMTIFRVQLTLEETTIT
jgi:hypothetical protein